MFGPFTTGPNIMSVGHVEKDLINFLRDPFQMHVSVLIDEDILFLNVNVMPHRL
jgi:hypothetical protein